MEERSKLQFRYIFLNAPDGSYMSPRADGINSIGLKDLESLKNVTVYPSHLIDLPYIAKLLFKLHNSGKINKAINLPGKELWFPKYYNFDISQDEKVCFICLNPHLSLAYMNYLQRSYPNAKFVKLHRDLLCHFHRRCPEWTEEALNNFFDLRLSYDEGDCEKYGLLFAPQYASKIDLSNTKDENGPDFFFCGRAKDRLEKIQKLIILLQKHGYRCEAYIFEASKEEQRKIEGIVYLDHEIPYTEVLRKEIGAKHILDINQGGASGVTLRVIESSMYRKKLITDNESILESQYYDPGLMMIIDESLSIDFDILDNWPDSDGEYDNRFSPINLIRQIDNELSQL